MTRQIRVGGVPIGGGAPVTIQSMTNTRTDDVSATAEQIKRLAAAGARLWRWRCPIWPPPGGGGHSGAEPHPSGGGHPFRLPAGPGVRGCRVRQSAH